MGTLAGWFFDYVRFQDRCKGVFGKGFFHRDRA